MSSSKRTNDFPASFVVSGNRDCLTVVNRIYRNPKLEITQNSSLSDTRGGRGTRLSVRPRRLVMNDGRESERSVETASCAARAHTRALASGSSKAQASRAFVEEPRREETRLARGSLGFLGARRVTGPADRTRIGSGGDRTDVDDGLRGVHARLHVEDQVRLRLPRAGP